MKILQNYIFPFILTGAAVLASVKYEDAVANLASFSAPLTAIVSVLRSNMGSVWLVPVPLGLIALSVFFFRRRGLMSQEKAGIIINDYSNVSMENVHTSGGPESVGFKIRRAPNLTMSNATSTGNQIGFDLEDIPDAVLNDIRADGRRLDQAAPKAAKMINIPLPEGMKKKTD